MLVWFTGSFAAIIACVATVVVLLTEPVHAPPGVAAEGGPTPPVDEPPRDDPPRAR